jgi:hypothetical protein
MKIKKANEDKYPSVNLAYEITLRSYDLAIKRADFIDDAIDKLIVWSTGLNLGIITLVLTKTNTGCLNNCFFYYAMAMFSITIILGYVAKLAGWLRTQNPRVLLESWLHKTEWEFKKDIIYFGSDHFEKNMAYVKRKAKFLGYATLIFLLEMVVLGLWVSAVTR